MSDNYRNGAFALGLVTGGGLVINVLVWSGFRGQSTGVKADADEVVSQDHYWVSVWDSLIGKYVIPEDTFAQWSMALLSLFAVILLWKTLLATGQTLKATRHMAGETTRLGEAQVAAHLILDSAIYDYRTPDSHLAAFDALEVISLKIENVGTTPAYNVMVCYSFLGLDDDFTVQYGTVPRDLKPGGTGTAGPYKPITFSGRHIDPGTIVSIKVSFDTIFSQSSISDPYVNPSDAIGRTTRTFDYQFMPETGEKLVRV